MALKGGTPYSLLATYINLTAFKGILYACFEKSDIYWYGFVRRSGVNFWNHNSEANQDNQTKFGWYMYPVKRHSFMMCKHRNIQIYYPVKNVSSLPGWNFERLRFSFFFFKKKHYYYRVGLEGLSPKIIKVVPLWITRRSLCNGSYKCIWHIRSLPGYNYDYIK